MDWFIERLNHINLNLDYQDLLNHSEDFKKLSDLKIITHKETLETIPCNLCDEDHAVSPFLNDKKEIIISCSGSSRMVNQDEMKIWKIDISHFLSLLQKALSIKGDIKNVVADDLWLIGTFQKDGKHFLVFYSRTNTLNSYNNFFDAFKSPVKSLVIFTNTETPLINLKNAEAVVIPLADIIELKNSSLSWDKKSFQEHLANAFRQVVFYPSNGDFVVLGKKIGDLTPSSPEYCFALILWNNFNQPVSHDIIFAYCKEKLEKQNDYTDTAQAFCNKMKSNIKKQIKNNAIAKIIISTKMPNGLNAYKMTNPN